MKEFDLELWSYTMKPDEKHFLINLYSTGDRPRELINSPNFYIPYKRAWYILEKWSNQDLYGYGCSLDLGWLTEKGKDTARILMEEFNND